jgi:hypothetical protein
MMQEMILSRFIDITKFYTSYMGKCSKYIQYSIINEPDQTISISFKGSDDITKNQIYINSKGFKIRTPSLLQPFINKKIIIYNDYINSSIDELFKIKPVDFKIENMIGLRYKYPYFTNTTLTIPFFYINKYLNECASIFRISFSLTNELILKKKQIRAAFTITKNDELLNYPLYKVTNGLKTKTMTKFLNLIDENNKFLEHFSYFDTIDVSFNKYGVMIFKEDR